MRESVVDGLDLKNLNSHGSPEHKEKEKKDRFSLFYDNPHFADQPDTVLKNRANDNENDSKPKAPQRASVLYQQWKERTSTVNCGGFKIVDGKLMIEVHAGDPYQAEDDDDIDSQFDDIYNKKKRKNRRNKKKKIKNQNHLNFNLICQKWKIF